MNTIELLNLNDSIKITSNELFKPQEAYEATFEDVLLEEVVKQEETSNKQNFQSKNETFGAPINFLAESFKNKDIFSSFNSKVGLNYYLLND